MTRNSIPSRHEVQHGSSLIVVVLLSMVIILGLLVIASNMTLASRRTTAEQRSNLPAQYAAETGVVFGKTKLRAAGNLLLVPMYAPVGVTYGDMQSYLKAMCPVPSAITLPLATPSGGWGAATVNIDGKTVSGSKICDLGNFSNSNVSFFTTLIPYSGSGSKASIYDSYGIQSSSLASYYSDLFNGSTTKKVGSTSFKGGLIPLALVQSGDYVYDFYFRIAPVESTGNINQSARKMILSDASGARRIRISFNVATGSGTPPNFSNFGFFINKFGGVTTGYYDNSSAFSGKVHTNQVWSLLGNSNSDSIRVDGEFSSTGCSSITTSTNASGDRVDTCSGGKKAAIYKYSSTEYSSNYQYQANMAWRGTTTGNIPGTTTSTTYNRYGTSTGLKINIRATSPANPAPNLSHDFINMPLNNNTQASMGRSGGIFMPYGASFMQLSTTGTKPNQYQQITITPKTSSGSSSSSVQLRYSSDKIMQIYTASGWKNAKRDENSLTGWIADTTGTGQQFNGMIYSDRDIGSLTGPTRISGASTAAGVSPSIASFAGITVTAKNNLTITGDLTYTDRCADVSLSSCYTKTNGQYDRQNVLGLYSYSGDILLGNQGSSTTQNTSSSYPNAPANLELDAFVMTGQGKFQPTSFTYSVDKGAVTVRGGMIKDQEAIVKSGSKGWTENYLFDRRGTDFSPPGFPTYTEGEAAAPVGLASAITELSITPSLADGTLTSSLEPSGDIRHVSAGTP